MRIHEKSDCWQLRCRYTLWMGRFFYIEFETINISDLLSHQTFFHLLSHALSARSFMKCMETRRLWKNAYAKLRWARLDSASTQDGQQSVELRHSLAQRSSHQAISSLFRKTLPDFFTFSRFMKHIHPSIRFNVSESNCMWLIYRVKLWSLLR